MKGLRGISPDMEVIEIDEAFSRIQSASERRVPLQVAVEGGLST